MNLDRSKVDAIIGAIAEVFDEYDPNPQEAAAALWLYDTYYKNELISTFASWKNEIVREVSDQDKKEAEQN